MQTSRFLALLGCAVALLAGLAVLPLPEQAVALALTAAIAAGIAMAAVLAGGGSTAPADPDIPASSPSPATPTASVDSDLLAELERHKALEQQLILAKQEAEAATMAKGEFLATMSHEIRTPLNGVIPLLDLLLSTQLTADQRDYLETAYGSSKELLRIVDDILDYSKLDASKLQLETVGINLRELTTGVLRLMEKSAESKGLRLGLAIDPAVRLAVRGDPVRLRQVLTNLVSNAIKFTDRGSVSVHISRLGETRTRNQLRFEVRDTGIGIAPEASARLFQAFSQADASTTRTFGGTGLGLAICKRIVTLMGGRIGVDSVPGKGSTFWFEVALDKALGDIEGRSPTETGDTRVLLVTANASQYRRFSLALPQWGMTLVHAANTQDALARLRSQAQSPTRRGFDIVLVDLASIPTTALALHRALVRETQPGKPLRVYLRSDDTLPAELESTPGFHVLMRDCADSELRARITSLLDAASDEPIDDALPPAMPAGASRPSPTPATLAHPTPPSTPIPTPTPAPAPASASVTAGTTSGVPSGGTPAGAASTQPPPVPSSGECVLLVEDNPVNRQVAQRLLSLAGIAFDSAENGKEALEKMNAATYIAVLMDCQMPIMDGYTATRQRRQHEQAHALPRLPIIAMTANAMLGDREKCLEAGMDDYLSKPLNRALLESTLRNWMGVRSVAPRPVAVPALPPAPPRPRLAVPSNYTSSTPAIDQAILDELREIMGAEFVSLIRVFLDDAPVAIERIQTLAAQQDLGGIAAPAHTLKSTSANLGAMTLSAQARTLEQEARQNNLSDAEPKAAALAAEFDRVASVLRRHIA
ncbi:ATP-binding protein [Xanthomonadaceae bacterium JHOS43]|nr:ATP-binding protein [Xanthomonadaceae bacterium JHOS43]